MRGQFVAAQIHGADRDGLTLHCAYHAQIRFVLLIFARQRRAVHEQKFGTEKTDTVSARAFGIPDVFGKGDVGTKADFHTVLGFSRTGVKALLPDSGIVEITDSLRNLRQQGRIRMYGENTVIRVQKHHIVTADVFGSPFHAHQGRNFK